MTRLKTQTFSAVETMQQIHDTAYPMLPAELGETELATVFTPSPAEIRFVADQYRQAPTRALILVQLKLYQRLGYCPPVSGVPTAIVHHVCSVLRIRPLLRSVLARYDRSGSKSRHQKLLRDFIGIRTTDAQTHAWLADVAAHAARIKTELPDIINVLIEELIRHRYELPPLAALTRIAAHARSQVNETIYRTIVEALGPDLIVRIDALFDNRGGRTGWDQVKREPKRPAPREIAGFLKHIEALRVLADGMPVAPEILTAPKCTQLVTEARALDVQEMRSLKPTKRYALAVLFILAQLQKALDDVAEIFIKTVRNLEHTAELRLQQYQLAHADQLEALVGQFRDVLGVLQDDTLPAEARVAKMRAALGGDPDGVLTRCNEHIAYAGNHTFPFMLRPYRNLRALLFQCLDLLSLRASSQDDALLRALDWMRSYRTSHREYLMLSDRDAANLPLGWIPDKWEKPIFPNGKSGRLMHRKYFELCVFSQIMRELKSGDIYVENSDQYDDPRVHQVSWEEFRAELPRYSELVNFPVDGKAFVQALKEELGIHTQTELANGDKREGFEIRVHDAQADSEKEFAVMSGGQKVWINECLTRGIALYRAQGAGTAFQTLFTDEADGPLDPERKREFMKMKREVLRQGGYEREFFISQTPDLVDEADAVIDVVALATQ
ncbi:DUF4158 domain-containing protein [Ralstonia mannitolilytica]